MFDVVVLAGGAARRLDGADKPGLEVGGRSMLERVLAAVGSAERIVVVGPPRQTSVPVIWTREATPGAGPVAALAAGLAHTAAPTVLVLAADLPWIAPAVAELLAALGRHDGAMLCDEGGRPNFLAGAWRRAALNGADLSAASMRQLIEPLDVALVADPAGWGRDCDTWDELRLAQTRSS